MRLHRSLLPFLAVALLAILVAACGGSDESSTSDSSGSRDAAATADNADVEPGSPEAVEEKTGGGGFAVSPELTSCMNAAGFAQDPKPVSGGIVSWRSDSGAQVVIASSSESALGIAGEIGTTEAPASVEGDRVSAGPAALTSAAAACLDA